MTRKAVELNDLKIVKKYVDDEIKEKVADALKEVVKQGNRLCSVGGFEVVDEQKKNTLFKISDTGVMYLGTDSPSKEEFLGSSSASGKPSWLKITDLSAFKDLSNRTSDVESSVSDVESSLEPIIDITFPAVNKLVTVYSSSGSVHRYARVESQEYLASPDYKRCKIKLGNNTYILDSTLRELISYGGGNGSTVKRSAKYDNGVLTLETTVYVDKDSPSLSVLLSANELSGTAQFYQTEYNSVSMSIAFPQNEETFPTPTQTSGGYYTSSVETSVNIPIITDEYDYCVINGMIIKKSSTDLTEIKRINKTISAAKRVTTIYQAQFKKGKYLKLITRVELVTDTIPQTTSKANAAVYYTTTAAFSQVQRDLVFMEINNFPTINKTALPAAALEVTVDGVTKYRVTSASTSSYSYSGYTKCILNGVTLTSDYPTSDIWQDGTLANGMVAYGAKFASGVLTLMTVYVKDFDEQPTSNIEINVPGLSPAYVTLSK